MKTLNTKPSELTRPWLRLATRLFVLPALATLMVVAAQAQVTYTPVFSNAWVVTAGNYVDLPANGSDFVRGVAINPVTTNVLYASRGASSNHVSVVSFASGSNFLGSLNALTVSAGTVAEAPLRVADDGAVYVCNVAGSSASRFLIFKYNGETTGVNPTIVYDSGAGTSFLYRVGDYIDVRGSGATTEIVVVGANNTLSPASANISTNFVVFRPTDATATTFTNFSLTIPGSTATFGPAAGGVAFEGTNNAIWIRENGSSNTRHLVYNPTNMTVTCDRTNTVDTSACRGLKYYKADNGVALLSCVQANNTVSGAQIARVFQIPTAPTGPFVSVLTSNLTVTTGSQNANILGLVDAKNGYFVFGAPGHGLRFFSVSFVTNSPPSVNVSGSSSTIVAGYGYGLTNTATASGSAPLAYQWYFTNGVVTNLISGATTNIYAITPIQITNAGGYFVIVTNLYGKATSSVVNVTVLPNGGSLLATQLWTLAPGSVGFLTGAGTDTQRGMGYDPIFQRLVVVSRAPTNGVHLVDAATAADLGEMDVGIIQSSPPGTFAINMCGVADDGVVYAGNLIISGNSDSYALYQWAGGATNTSTMTLSYLGNPLSGAGSLGRIGDTMAVRGAGTNTQVLCGFRSGTNACIFTTADGANFTPTIIAIDNIPDGADGLSVFWGPSNTFWTKSDFNLRQVSYDLVLGTGTVIHSYPVPTTETIVGVDNANGYAATIGTRETPQNLAIYDITTPGGPSINTLVDRELFAANNPPGNATGEVAVDVTGGRIFALDSNSGILAVTYAGRLAIAKSGSEQIVTWPTAASTLQCSTNVAGPYADVMGATSPYTNSTGTVKFFRLKH